MLNSPLENPLFFFRRAHNAHCAEGTNFKYCSLRHCARKGACRIIRGGFKGDLSGLRSFPLNRFLGIVLLRLKRMIRPAAAAANLKTLNN